MKTPSKKKTTRTAGTTVDWKVLKKSHQNMNAVFLENVNEAKPFDSKNELNFTLANSTSGRNTAGKRIGTALIVDQIDAHSFARDKTINHVKRAS